tara:strand:+ start:252 stop:473 length:222 start_codon:yes stop_codon:yes gene_type:complete
VLNVSNNPHNHHLVFLLNTHILLTKAFSKFLTAQYSKFKALFVFHNTLITLSSITFHKILDNSAFAKALASQD